MAMPTQPDLIRAVLRVFEAGRINSDQEQAIADVRVMLGDLATSCKHDMDSTCDVNNVFHCNGCGDVVPAP